MGWPPPISGGSLAGSEPPQLCPCPSEPGKPPQDTPPLAVLFGPPLESAFEAEEFPGEDLGGSGGEPPGREGVNTLTGAVPQPPAPTSSPRPRRPSPPRPRRTWRTRGWTRPRIPRPVPPRTPGPGPRNRAHRRAPAPNRSRRCRPPPAPPGPSGPAAPRAASPSPPTSPFSAAPAPRGSGGTRGPRPGVAAAASAAPPHQKRPRRTPLGSPRHGADPAAPAASSHP